MGVENREGEMGKGLKKEGGEKWEGEKWGWV